MLFALVLIAFITQTLASPPIIFSGVDAALINSGNSLIVDVIKDPSGRPIIYMNSTPAGGDSHVMVDNAAIESIGINGRFLKENNGVNLLLWAQHLLTIVDAHLKSTRVTAPTAAVNANAGTGATCSVSNASDIAGSIALTSTAVAPSAGTQCTITFNVAYGTAPICLVTPTNGNSILQSVVNGTYFTTTTTTLLVTFSNSDVTGHAYTWAYHCIETQ